jgi:hypothetical protein
MFNASLDGTPYNDNGYSPKDIFQQILFAATELSAVNHNVTIVDSPTDLTEPYLDVDFVRSASIHVPLLTHPMIVDLPGGGPGRIQTDEGGGYARKSVSVFLLRVECEFVRQCQRH